jgi:large subunit ribosomal protein L35
MKTKKAAKKRFVVTAKGKLLHKGGLSSHLKEHKSARRLRAQKEPHSVTATETRMIKRLLNK